MADSPSQEIEWRTSSFTDGVQCVRVAERGDDVLVSDSKDPDGPALRFTRGEMSAFIKGVHNNEFDDLV